jgi:Fe-S oxidoreductase
MTAPAMEQNRPRMLNGNLQTSTTGDYLYFMGCLPYFDVIFSDEGIKPGAIAENTVKILNYFGIKPQVLSNEKCCGHDAYWNGDKKTFQNLANSNIEQIKQTKAKTIITSCPECYRTLKIDYPLHFGKQNYEVRHISEFLAENIKTKQPKLKHNPQHVTFQDPCRLGRHLGIYEPPRAALKAIPGLEFSEMGHHHKRSICCGVTGWMNCSQVSKQIQINRLQEVKASGAETLVTACAKCLIHFNCALKDDRLRQEIPVVIKDLTEVVAESLV